MCIYVHMCTCVCLCVCVCVCLKGNKWIQVGALCYVLSGRISTHTKKYIGCERYSHIPAETSKNALVLIVDNRS